MERKSAHDFFYFTKKEKNGIIVLLIVNLFFILLPHFYEKLHPAEKFLTVVYDSLAFLNDQSFSKGDSFNLKKYNHTYSGSRYAYEKSQHHLFEFDPNTISEEEWISLGVYPKTIATIQHYKEKGGRFLKAEDLKKIWGFSDKKIIELLPYVRISENSASREVRHTEKKTTIYKKELININTCDSAILEKLPGIGPKLSQRMISFRERLGGFYCKEQLLEVFGLADSVFQKFSDQIVIDINAIREININKAGRDEFKNHPYIKFKIADAIVKYREQHGAFNDIEQLKNIVLIDDVLFKKLRFYLTIDKAKN